MGKLGNPFGLGPKDRQFESDQKDKLMFLLGCRNMSKSSSSGGGISIGMVLFLIFLVLKLTGVIAWSWWWVTCPLWIGLIVLLGIIVIGLAVGGGVLGLAALLSKRK